MNAAPPKGPDDESRKPRPFLDSRQWARQGSNLRPTDYESAALTN